MASQNKAKLSLLLIGIALCLCYILSYSTTNKLSISSLELAEFEKFVITHNKNYPADELKLRYEIFTTNIKAIRVYNSFTKDFVLAINKFGDLSPEEFASMYTEEIHIKPNKKLEVTDKRLRLPPTSFDWRDKGAVTDVVNQGMCKSSWAIATTGAVEGARVAQGLLDLENLSSQEVLDCVSGTGDHGCAGGIVEDAYTFVEKNGLTSDIVYPYTGVNQTCITSLVAKNITYINDFYDVIVNDPSRLMIAVAYTPTVAVVESKNYVWQFYYSGVVNNYCGINVSHYVLVVGYDSTAPIPYFTAKNSWGGDWGESGYIRIGMQGGQGVCGIQISPSYPIF
jgi:KDEL-tailed cysteine endopeptidase